MDNYSIFLVALLVIFGLHATYTDLKEKKIKNLCAYGLIYAGILAQSIYILSGRQTVFQCTGTALGGFAIAFALHWFGVFAPGDAKFFCGASLLLPYDFFSQSGFATQFAPFVLAMNIFIPYFLVLTAYLLIKTTTKQKWQAVARIAQMEDLPKKILDMVFRLCLLLGLKQAVSISTRSLGLEIELVHLVLIAFALYLVINHLVNRFDLEKWRNYVICPLLLELMLLSTPFTLNAWSQGYLPLVKIYLLYITVFFFLRLFIHNLDSIALDQEVDIFSLKEGMVPAEQIMRFSDDQGEVVYRKADFALPNVLDSRVVLATLPGGISSEKITELKELAREGKFQEFDNRISIQQSLRFAPIIFVGIVLTILCRGPFFILF